MRALEVPYIFFSHMLYGQCLRRYASFLSASRLTSIRRSMIRSFRWTTWDEARVPKRKRMTRVMRRRCRSRASDVVSCRRSFHVSDAVPYRIGYSMSCLSRINDWGYWAAWRQIPRLTSQIYEGFGLEIVPLTKHQQVPFLSREKTAFLAEGGRVGR